MITFLKKIASHAECFSTFFSDLSYEKGKFSKETE